MRWKNRQHKHKIITLIYMDPLQLKGRDCQTGSEERLIYRFPKMGTF